MRIVPSSLRRFLSLRLKQLSTRAERSNKTFQRAKLDCPKLFLMIQLQLFYSYGLRLFTGLTLKLELRMTLSHLLKKKGKKAGV